MDMVTGILRLQIAMLAALVFLGGCGSDAPSREAVAAMEAFEQLLATADGGRTILPYEKEFAEVRRKYIRVHDDLMVISDKRERMKVAMRMEKQLDESIVARSTGFGELRFLVRSNVMFEGLVKTVWETTGDERRVFTLWERRRRKCVAAAERCERENAELEKDEKRLLLNAMTVGTKLAKVSMQELTAEEREKIKEAHEKRPRIAERLRAFYFLISQYRLRVPGKEGMTLADGKLYERFQKLSQKELDELVRK